MFREKYDLMPTAEPPIAETNGVLEIPISAFRTVITPNKVTLICAIRLETGEWDTVAMLHMTRPGWRKTLAQAVDRWREHHINHRRDVN